MSDLGLEPWEQIFHDRNVRDQERRNASVPDYGDWHLYGDDPGVEDGDDE